MTDPKKQTSPFDAKIGDNVRKRRMVLGMSQERLGELLGLTFQQIQKYEKGVNRISAGRLFEVSGHLKSPIELFYDGLPLAGDAQQGFAESNEDSKSLKFATTAEGIQLNAAFIRIKDPKVRKRVLDLIKSMAEEAVAYENER